MKRIAILGSTGSIGRSTLEVIASHPDRLELIGVAAHSRIESLSEQITQYSPRLIAVWDPENAAALSRKIHRQDILVGTEGLIQMATHPDVDVVVVATTGSQSLLPLLRAIASGKQIALATKELLVMAGELVMRLVQEHGSRLIPIDSEHAALFQCLQGVPPEQVRRLVITGSGGPLWAYSREERKTATRAQVLAHPKWQMGPKITVDSATLMNKGLELIEARWLFQLGLEQLGVVIHPEAVVHGLVELIDGSIIAQMSPCDMRLPIQYALSFPERWTNLPPALQLTRLSGLHFLEPDETQFPCLRLASEAAEKGGSACVVLNGANDVAVAAYLEGQIQLGDIPILIEELLLQHVVIPHPTLDEIFSVDAWVRQAAVQKLPSPSRKLAASADRIER